MKITFHGATKSVTGSMTLIESKNILVLVDAGLYQGVDAEENILSPLPYNPKNVDAVFLTHAHLDHSGLLPRLARLGFRGPIFCTPQTAKLVRIILNDSAELLEKNPSPRMQNFYTIQDVQTIISHLKPIAFDSSFQFEHLTIRFKKAGHILGAASVEIKEQKRILFSGDLGRSDDVLIPPPAQVQELYDLVVMESTYGNKIRPPGMEADLKSFLVKLKTENKIGILASFAVARAQTLIYLIYHFFQRHPEYKIPVFIDGPMLQEASKVYEQFAEETKDPQGLRSSLEYFETIEHFRQRKHVQHKEAPFLILSSSGMLSGGPIMSHLKAFAHESNVALFLPGYMAPGTLGYLLSKGERTLPTEDGVTLHWTGEIIHSESFSSHADQNELLSWVKSAADQCQIALLHGEEESKKSLKILLEKKHPKVIIPISGDSIEI
jgi:metallo-beta-lactamase family protein